MVELKRQKEVGMQLEVNLVATQFAILRAQKFALRLILLTNQLVEEGIVVEKSEIIDEIHQSCVIVGLLMTRLTVRESPSKVI
jgi:hypothetical protein